MIEKALKTRKVELIIPLQAEELLNLFGSNIIELQGVQSIRITEKTDVAVSTGLVKNFLHPWFLKPVEIEITGKTYYGAFEGMAETKHETFGKKFLTAMSAIGKYVSTENASPFSLKMYLSRSEIVILKGYIEAFNLNEDINEPFIFEYTLKFIGEFHFINILNEAKKAYTVDFVDGTYAAFALNGKDQEVFRNLSHKKAMEANKQIRTAVAGEQLASNSVVTESFTGTAPSQPAYTAGVSALPTLPPEENRKLANEVVQKRSEAKKGLHKRQYTNKAKMTETVDNLKSFSYSPPSVALNKYLPK